MTLTAEQLAALRVYEAQHGRYWKEALRQDWFYARATGVLQVLRNTHGPTWLHTFRLPTPYTEKNYQDAVELAKDR